MKTNSELKSEAYNLLSQNWGNAIGFTFILFCVSIASSLVPLIGDLIGIIIAGPLAFGTAIFFLKISKGKKAEIEDLFTAFKSKELFFSSLSAYLYTLLIIIPIFIICIIIWVTLFVGDFDNIITLLNNGISSLMATGKSNAPYTMDPSFLSEYSSPLFDSGIGLIILSALIIIFVPITIVSLLLSQVFFILADQKTTNSIDAIKMSWNLMRNNKKKLFFLQLRFIGWIILSVFTFFIGLLFLYPYMLTSYSKFYQNLYD